MHTHLYHVHVPTIITVWLEALLAPAQARKPYLLSPSTSLYIENFELTQPTQECLPRGSVFDHVYTGTIPALGLHVITPCLSSATSLTPTSGQIGEPAQELPLDKPTFLFLNWFIV